VSGRAILSCLSAASVVWNFSLIVDFMAGVDCWGVAWPWFVRDMGVICCWFGGGGGVVEVLWGFGVQHRVCIRFERRVGNWDSYGGSGRRGWVSQSARGSCCLVALIVVGVSDRRRVGLVRQVWSWAAFGLWVNRGIAGQVSKWDVVWPSWLVFLCGVVAGM